MMRRHYRRAYGRFGREYVPPPVPAWMLDDTTLRERAPWRRGRAAAANVREAVEGFDEDLKMRTLRWWGAVDLRRTAVETENARRIAARGRWGREGGDGALASGAGFIGVPNPRDTPRASTCRWRKSTGTGMGMGDGGARSGRGSTRGRFRTRYARIAREIDARDSTGKPSPPKISRGGRRRRRRWNASRGNNAPRRRRRGSRNAPRSSDSRRCARCWRNTR